jgi:hypothetical protein
MGRGSDTKCPARARAKSLKIPTSWAEATKAGVRPSATRARDQPLEIKGDWL